jgi:hypothetical protein
MKPGSSRRDFIRRALFGGAIAGLLSRAAPTSGETESRSVDRRKLGRIGADVSILGNYRPQSATFTAFKSWITWEQSLRFK